VSGQARLRTISVRGTEEAANITSIADIGLTEDEAPVLEIVGFGHRGFEEIVQSLGGLNSRLDTPLCRGAFGTDLPNYRNIFVIVG